VGEKHMRKLWMWLIFVGVVGFLGVSTVRADSVSEWVTGSGATAGGQPVSASAVITIGAGGNVTVTLTNNFSNPTSRSQAVSGFIIIFSDGSTSGTITSSSSNLININSDGTITNLGSGSTGWKTETSSGGLSICTICPNTGNAFAPPSHLLIGPPGSGGTYSAANASITGTNPGSPDPWLQTAATFNLNIPGLSPGATVVGVIFLFGTDSEQVPGVFIPEPGTLALVGSGLLAIGRQWRRRRKAA
jgi:hypothetical protein